MQISLALIGLAAWAFQAAQVPAPKPPAGASPIVNDLTHASQTMGRTMSYQVLMPPAYATSKKRYPAIYWFHGYEQSSSQRDAEIAAYVAAHDLMVIHVGPVETVGAFPLYFPELVDHIDKTLRTLADRDHRAVTGFSSGGFMAWWLAGKFPDLVSSASSFMGFTEASVGPSNLDVENRLDDLYGNYEGVRTRLVTGTRDFLSFYLGRLSSVWVYTRPGSQMENFDSDHAAPGIAKTLDFHMQCFANPLPRPATFSHADVYPDFSVWGWEVGSERRQPGFTVLQTASGKGFRSAVRQWIPGGATIPEVKLSVTSARLYVPGSPHPVTYLRLRDGNLRKASQKADSQGRLSFELTGDEYEVGIGPEPQLALTAFGAADGTWATAGQPVKLKVQFRNKGQARSGTSIIQWESPNPGVKFDPQTSRLFGLGPGEAADAEVTVSAPDDGRAMVKVFAVEGANRMPMEVMLFPAAPPVTNFHIADGQVMEAYRHAVQRSEETFGEGNGDGHAAPGESFAVLLPDGEYWRAAEVFSSDACVENVVRGSDSWAEYDRAGASATYSLPSIRAECPPGHVVHMLARVLIPHAPDHQMRYASIEFPVWWRRGEEPKKP